MNVKDFFNKLEKFCADKPEHIDADTTKCHVCELRDFCYSPPDHIKENCSIEEVIQFVNELK